MCLQVTGPAAQLFSALQPRNIVRFHSRAGRGGISAAAAAPLRMLRRTAAAAGGRVQPFSGMGRALLQGLKSRLQPWRAAPGRDAADVASRVFSSQDAKFAAASAGSGGAEPAGSHAGRLQHSLKPAVLPTAGVSTITASRGSRSAGSSMSGVAAAVAQLQQQMAELHDEVAALRGSLAGLSGGPAAEEVRDRAWPHSGGTVCVFCSGKGSGEGNT
jgi:hypothetical protein